MRDPGTSCGASPDHPIWRALERYSIGPIDAELGFTDRLARENGWSSAFADRVVEEYRRFCFLATIDADPKTPSDAVDQAWHLHLTYTRDYWDRFCPETLGRPLHHGPTAGGGTELARYHEQYAQTLRSYERAFRQAPPHDIWPSAVQRLLEDPQARRVHPRDAFVVPRRRAYALLTLIAVLFGVLIALPFMR